MTKKRRKQNNVNRRGTENRRRSTDQKLKNPIIGLPDPDVANIPCNEIGTFVEKLYVKCSFCPKTFGRADDYYLHHAEKHAKLFVTLPKLPNDNASENVKNKEGTKINQTLDAVIKKRKRTCTLNVYKNHKADMIGDDDSDDDKFLKIPENPKVPVDAVNLIEIPKLNSNSSAEVTEPRRKTKRQSRKAKQTDDDSSSSSSESDDTCSDADIQNILNMFVKKLSRSLIKNLRNKIVKRNKKQRKIYECNKCCLQFIKEDEWRKHMKRIHSSDTESHRKRKFDQNSLANLAKISNKSIKLQSIAETSSESEDISTNENSGSDNEEQTSVPNTNQTYKTSVGEFSKSDKEQEKLGKQNENKNDQVEYGIPQAEQRKVQVNARKGKRILYKCDDCEEHFLSKENVEKHTKNKTHHRMQKNTTCEYCTYKFSSTSTLKTHLRLHQEYNLTKDDFKVILWTKFGRRVPEKRRVMNPKPKNSSFPRQHSNQINKRGCRTYDETLIYRCEGCDVHFLKYTTWISHTHKCNNIPKEKCLKCERYFSKKILIHHEEIHRRRPNLKRDDFKIKCRKPVFQENVGMPQSNIVSTTEDNVDNPIIVQGTAGADEAENDPCKVKLSKTTDNTWIVSNNKKCGEKSTNGNGNEGDDNMNSHDRSTMKENSSEGDTTDSSGQAAVTESTNNIASTNNLENPVSTENDKENRLEENVQSTFFDKSQYETQSAVASIAIRQLANNKSTNAPDSNTDQNKNQQNKDEISVEIKAEPCSITKLDPSIKNELIIEKIKPKNDKSAPKTQTDKKNMAKIKIVKCYSSRLTFEDSDTQNGFEEPTSSQNKVEINVQIVDSSDVKDNAIKPETLQSSHARSNFDEIVPPENKTKYLNKTVQQKTYRDRNDIDCYDDDSRDTLLLVPDYERELPADENVSDQVNDIESNNTAKISTTTVTDTLLNGVQENSKSFDRNSITPVGTSNETLYENNDHAIENQASYGKNISSNRRTTEFDIEQQTFDFGCSSSHFRVRNRSECKENSQNKNDTPEVESMGIKKESKQEHLREKNISKSGSCKVDNNQEIISLDSDDDAVGRIPDDMVMIDLSSE